MAHARLIKTCQQCLKTIRVDIVQQACEVECVNQQRATFAYCPICHKTTNQLADLVHIGVGPDIEVGIQGDTHVS